MLKPFSHPVIVTVLAFVAAAGGYGGYQVIGNRLGQSWKDVNMQKR